MFIVQDEILWLIETAKKNGVSKEDFLLWYKENQQQAGEKDVANKKL